MYFVVAGELNVISDGRVVFVLGEGHFFGEIALLYDTERTASLSLEHGANCSPCPRRNSLKFYNSSQRKRVSLKRSGPASTNMSWRRARKADHRHSMLVVGHRTERGKLRLLLQNWWRKKQFVEVDEEYFESCNEFGVMFVITPQTHFPPLLDVTGCPFSIGAADGAGVVGIGEPTLCM